MARTETIDADRVHGFVAHADNPSGGVLILPTISGVDRPLQTLARQLADSGLTAMVWDPFPGDTATPNEFSALMARAGKLSDDLVDTHMSACIDHMLGPLQLGAVAVLGFCLGGRYAVLLAAHDGRVAACVAYYPSIRVPMKPNESRDAIAVAAQIPCPVHLVHAGNDEVILYPVFEQLRKALEQRSAATFTQIHPGAVHSFMRPDLQAQPANGTAARLSWPPVATFLHERLRAA
jgi:carboxymethylenebutenolidase